MYRTVGVQHNRSCGLYSTGRWHAIVGFTVQYNQMRMWDVVESAMAWDWDSTQYAQYSTVYSATACD